MSAVEDFVAERRSRPWPSEPWPVADVPAAELYQRYRDWMKERGDKPLSQVEFGVALGAVPGITRTRIPAGHVYSGVTVQTRVERAHKAVHAELFAAELHARADQPWVERYKAHRMKHVQSFVATGTSVQCDHAQPPEVVEGLSDVEATIAPAIPPTIEAEYGPYLRFRPEGPNPELVALLAAGAVADGLKPALRASGEYVDTREEKRLAALWAADWGMLQSLPDDDEEAFAAY